jgi:hypothetical protein
MLFYATKLFDIDFIMESFKQFVAIIFKGFKLLLEIKVSE